jgi:hypothetical protein
MSGRRSVFFRWLARMTGYESFASPGNLSILLAPGSSPFAASDAITTKRTESKMLTNLSTDFHSLAASGRPTNMDKIPSAIISNEMITANYHTTKMANRCSLEGCTHSVSSVCSGSQASCPPQLLWPSWARLERRSLVRNTKTLIHRPLPRSSLQDASQSTGSFETQSAQRKAGMILPAGLRVCRNGRLLYIPAKNSPLRPLRL